MIPCTLRIAIRYADGRADALQTVRAPAVPIPSLVTLLKVLSPVC